MNEVILSFYRRQSTITNPGAYGVWYDTLPNDVAGLIEAVQNVLIHPFYFHLYPVEKETIQNVGFGIRDMASLLAKIIATNDVPLTTPRPWEQRIGAICRNFAVLFVSMARHKGIPARERVGFAGYFGEGDTFWDHRVAEYWSEQQHRWVLVDPQIDEVQRLANGIQFNTLDIQPHDRFHFVGTVWRKCRIGEADPLGYADSPTDRGMPPIRYALLHDFDALNQYELLGSDAWHELIDKPETTMTPIDYETLDEIAGLLESPDHSFDAMHTLYKSLPYGQAVQKQLVVALMSSY